ncbi:MAG: glycosyltransferase family 2 protein [Nanoarchaeota archaeon]|nr:glycosyltransferase family 2 protein [Nanoarchaeota archaeon]
MKQPKVAIIIGTLNQEEKLNICLESLKKTDYSNYKIFLLDDSGKGHIGRKIKKSRKDIRVIINPKNLGFSKFNNIGIKFANKEWAPRYFLLLNDDTEIVEGKWLKTMVNAGEREQKAGIIGCKVAFPNGQVQWPKNKENIKDVIGACFLIKKSVIEKIGLFDEKFSPVYGEESDFCFRASKAGFKIVYVDKTRVIHYGSSSTNTMFNENIWFLKKRHAIRLEWLNYSFGDILKYTVIHFGSAIISKNPFKKTILLLKAYKENINNIREIEEKREERNSWKIKTKTPR